MTEGAIGVRDVADGLGVLLSTNSFAARALLGSLIAALLAALAVRLNWVRSRRARRGLVLAPLATAASAAVASAGDTFLPQVLVSTSGDGQRMEFFGEGYHVRQLAWLLVAYAAIASFLLLRRLVSHLAIRAYVRRAEPCRDPAVQAIVRRLASKLGIAAPPVLLSHRCPGGAFTTGLRHAVICLDPTLVKSLDVGELEGLLAHELAHVARRDVALNLAVGVVGDLTFFLAPLHFAARWLRHEQEHAADDLASQSTGRPAALASSILKVWQGSTARGTAVAASMACATMVPAYLPVPAGMPSRILRQGGLRGGAKLIAERVVRLIERQEPASTVRERAEMVLLGAVLIALSAVTVLLPAQMDSEIFLGQWSRPPAQPVESPVMATYQALNPSATSLAGVTIPVVAPVQPCLDCLVVESVSNYRQATAPTIPARTGGRMGAARFPWDYADQTLPDGGRAEPLWGVDSPTTRLGVFVVR